VQVHFTDMPDYALTVHGLLSLAANPMACRRDATRHMFDAMLGQVFWRTFIVDWLPTYWFVSIFPLAEGAGLYGRGRLLHDRWASSVGRSLYGQ